MTVFKNIDNLQQGYLKKINPQLHSHQELLVLIKKSLPANLAEQVIYALPKKNTLTIFTAHSNWSSQIRFLQTPLLYQLEQSGYFFNDLQLKIIPPLSVNQSERHINPPSTDTIEFLSDQAEHMKDKKLKQALLKLTNTLRRQESNKN
jgi:hypothetical protein